MQKSYLAVYNSEFLFRKSLWDYKIIENLLLININHIYALPEYYITLSTGAGVAGLHRTWLNSRPNLLKRVMRVRVMTLITGMSLTCGCDTGYDWVECWLCRVRRLKDVVKSAEQLSESVESLRQWLLDVSDQLMTAVVYQRADSAEIQRHLSEQQVIILASDTKAFVWDKFGIVCWLLNKINVKNS